MAAFDEHRPPARALIADCVHCGFCLPTCPTYALWGEEMDSPRGRIVLMDEGLREGSEFSAAMVTHFDRCLGCMACVTACPSDVRYDLLIGAVRPQVERHAQRSLRERLRRRTLLGVLSRPGLLRALVPGLMAGRLLGFRLAPNVPLRAAWRRLPARAPARGARRGSVGLLQGCVARIAFGSVNEAAVHVLTAEGFEVSAPREPRCCGALALHTGAEQQARALAKETIAALEGAETVLATAAGCGSAMKEYGHLLADEPAWAARAEAFAGTVRDVTEFLGEGEPRAARAAIPLRLVYHDACHLAHAQGIRAQPRALLASIPSIELVEPDEWELCCGSAGLYNLLQPDAARELGHRKASKLLATGAQAIATANPGCTLQIAAALRELGRPLPIYHPVELIAQAIAGHERHRPRRIVDRRRLPSC